MSKVACKQIPGAPMPVLPLVMRFQHSRWSKTRQRIDAMKPGQTLDLAASEYFNAKASVDRLNDAYAGTRAWTCHRVQGAVQVMCKTQLPVLKSE